MKIAICIKHVPTAENVEVNEETHQLIRDTAESDTNPCDLNALEFALQLKNATDGTIDVFSMGPENAMASLKKSLAIGADNAYLLADKRFAGSDTLGTARVLAAGIKTHGPYDVIFTGSESSDGGTGQVGPMIAEIFGMPDVSETVSVTAADGRLDIKKRVEGGNMLLHVATPVVLTVPFGCNEPTLPTLRSQRQANKADIPHVDDDALAIDDKTIGMPGALSIVTDVHSASSGRQAEEISGTFGEIAGRIGELIEEGRA